MPRVMAAFAEQMKATMPTPVPPTGMLPTQAAVYALILGHGYGTSSRAGDRRERLRRLVIHISGVAADHVACSAAVFWVQTLRPARRSLRARGGRDSRRSRWCFA